MLWRRYQPQTQTVGKTKGREKRMKQMGNVEIPQEAFMAVLKLDD